MQLRASPTWSFLLGWKNNTYKGWLISSWPKVEGDELHSVPSVQLLNFYETLHHRWTERVNLEGTVLKNKCVRLLEIDSLYLRLQTITPCSIYMSTLNDISMIDYRWCLEGFHLTCQRTSWRSSSVHCHPMTTSSSFQQIKGTRDNPYSHWGNNLFLWWETCFVFPPCMTLFTAVPFFSFSLFPQPLSAPVLQSIHQL